jgi:probable F420-dependent oxidoreductase
VVQAAWRVLVDESGACGVSLNRSARLDLGHDVMNTPRTSLQLGRIGAWFNPRYGDDARTEFVVQAESLGFPTAWLGVGRASISDLAFVERVLDATTTITVATAIVNIWTNDPADIARAYQRIASRHPDRFLLGVGVGHPESIRTYRQPYATMVEYLDRLDADGVPKDRRILAALSPRTLELAAERTLRTHPYLVVPDHTRAARQLLGPHPVIAPEHTVVLETDPDIARGIGRPFVADPYLKLRNYTNNLRRYGYTDDDIAGGGSDRLIDALVLHGGTDAIAAGLHAHLDAGADHVAIQVLTEPDHDPMPAYQQLAHALL